MQKASGKGAHPRANGGCLSVKRLQFFLLLSYIYIILKFYSIMNMNYRGAWVGVGGLPLGWFVIKDHSHTSHDAPCPEANSVAGRWQSRHAGHEKSLLAI